MHRIWILLAASLALSGCDDGYPCYGRFWTCTVDEQCDDGWLPPGRCLDDRETGRVCAVYYHSCPLRLRWSECAGVRPNRSSWAGRCVRPEFLPEFDGGTSDGTAPPDMTASVDGPAPM